MTGTNVSVTQPESSSSQTALPVLESQNRHNICTFLDEDALNAKLKKQFEPIFVFLRRSRVSKAISANTIIKKSQVEDFWHSAKHVTEEGHDKIVAEVSGNKITVTESGIRSVLSIGDSSEDRIDPNDDKVRAILMRCGFPHAKGKMNKREFCPHFKYLAHVVIHSLGSFKGGYDALSRPLQHCMAALVSNMKYNFSRMIFNGMVKNAEDTKTKFLQYPRFVQLLINSCQFEIADKGESDILVLNHMNVDTMFFMNSYGSSPRPRDVPLFGHIINPDYVCPEGNEWKHPNSDSEDRIVIDVPDEPEKPKSKRKGKSVEDVGFERPSVRRKLHVKIKDTAAASSDSQNPTPPPTAESGLTVESLNALIVKLRSDTNENSRRLINAELKAIAAEKLAEAAKKKSDELEKKNKELEDRLKQETNLRLVLQNKVDKMICNDDGFYVDPAFLSTSRIDDDSSSSDDSPRRIEDTGTDHE